MINFMLKMPDSLASGGSYKVGYYIGMWLPFIILGIITFIVLRAGQKRR